MQRARLAVAIGLAAVATLLIGIGALAWTVTDDLVNTTASLGQRTADLEAANVDLAETRKDLTETTDELGRIQNDLSLTRGNLAREQQLRASAEQRIPALEDRIRNQDTCIGRLADHVDELNRIRRLVIDSYNHYAEGSDWSNANEERDLQLRNAIKYYYNAYDAAVQGLWFSAGSWADQGFSAVELANAQFDVQVAEVQEGDALLDTVEASTAALTAAIARTEAECGL